MPSTVIFTTGFPYPFLTKGRWLIPKKSPCQVYFFHLGCPKQHIRQSPVNQGLAYGKEMTVICVSEQPQLERVIPSDSRIWGKYRFRPMQSRTAGSDQSGYVW